MRQGPLGACSTPRTTCLDCLRASAHAQAPVEPCEEVRLGLARLLACLVALGGKALVPYAGEAVALAEALAADPYHEVQAGACSVVVQLNGAWGTDWVGGWVAWGAGAGGARGGGRCALGCPMGGAGGGGAGGMFAGGCVPCRVGVCGTVRCGLAWCAGTDTHAAVPLHTPRLRPAALSPCTQRCWGCGCSRWPSSWWPACCR